MALVLHLDTSGSTATVLLARDGVVIAGQELADQREQSALLNGMIAAVLEEGNSSCPALDAIAVCNGPGSYTGLRIGLATAKALCYVWDKPLLLQNRLLLMAASNTSAESGTVLAALPARQGEFFAAAIDAGGHTTLPPAHFFTADLLTFLERMTGKVTIVGPAGSELVTETSENYAFVPNETILTSVRTSLAENQITMREYADLRLSQPFYLKAAYMTTPVGNK